MSGGTQDKIMDADDFQPMDAKAAGGIIPQTATDQQVKALFLDRVSELWDVNWSDFKRVLDSSDGTKAKMAFGASLDYSDSSPKLKTSITFSKPFSDERLDELGDPNQPELPVFGDMAQEPTDQPHVESADVPDVDGVAAAKAARKLKRLIKAGKITVSVVESPAQEKDTGE